MSADCRTKLVVIVVTYGNRNHLLTQVLERLATLGPLRVVAVFNGNAPPAHDPANRRLVIVKNDTNLGSAGGFRTGIEAALQLEAEYYLLLDDDNLPAADCLDRLFAAHVRLGGGPLVALQAFRPSQPWQRVVVREGVNPIGRVNTYGWFNFVNERHLLRRQLGPRDLACELNTMPANSLVRIGVAAYGGLFLRREALLLSEMPDQRYFCYYDDLDFTDRLVRRGVSIHLCADAVIHDLDTSWHARDERAHPAFSPKTSDLQIFLDLRNAFIFYRSRMTNRALYLLNGIGFWLGIVYLALFRSTDFRTAWRRLALIRRAVWYGSRGKFEPCPESHPDIQRPRP
ncbi:MAG: glycosyltransferase family 2 protein [Candidatus Accumulibacter sp.]|uniref:Glycosyltransferase family 2 protein n=1 Tax=Candidatus Accumulibacter affinis TaxID=2954384 RepID=A0A935T9Q2_9PROT|nr:glycosyltransferase family 2 protein [Candidatus Accumulibacter affinis]